MKFASRSLVLLALGAASSGTFAASREITFADRVRAQQAIERVYYEHQIRDPMYRSGAENGKDGGFESRQAAVGRRLQDG